MRWLLSGIGVLGAGIAMIASANDALPARERGEDIYFGRTGGISCAGCHGLAGQGGEEGGTSIPPLSELAVFGPPPSDANRSAFCRALRTGELPDGRTLSGFMPRLDLSDADCAAVLVYIAGLSSTDLLGFSDSEVRVAVDADTRNSAQLAWREQIVARFLRVNADGGLHGRKVRILAPNEPGDVLFSIALGSGPTPPRTTLFTIAMRGEAVVPFVRTIETSRRDEAEVVLGLYPKASIALFVDEDDPVAHEAFADRAADNGASITGINNCGSPAAEVVIVLDLPNTGLTSCPAARSVLLSLRQISIGHSGDVARISARQVEFAVPVPMGQSFRETSDRLAQVVTSTLRDLGRHPDKADAIIAFERAWRLKAARPGSMFSGVTVGSIDGDSEGRWIAVP